MSRMLAYTVYPLRASVSADSRPNPVLEPVINTTRLEVILDASVNYVCEL